MLPGSSRRYTVRLNPPSYGVRRKTPRTASPPYTGFIAAGFFFAHASVLELVPMDPFMPYIFMGEEITITMRFWTEGFDVYGPSEDVLAHEYIRKHGIKFWESINHVYRYPDMHNAISGIV